MNKLILMALLFAIPACKKDDDNNGNAATSKLTITPSLQRIAAANVTTLLGSTNLTNTTLGAYRTSNVNIKSMKYPIGSISISDAPTAPGTTASAGGNNSFAIYDCTGTTNDACLVELTGDALTNLLANAPEREARIGTFSQINVSPCFPGGKSEDIRVKFTAEVTIDTTLYYTNATTGLSTTGPAEEVTIAPNGGCGVVRFLTNDLIITADSFKQKTRPVGGEGPDAGQEVPAETGALTSKLEIKLYFDLANALFAFGPSTATNAADEIVNGGNCKGDTSRVNASICVNYPEIVATIDSGSPTLTRMMINDSTIWGFYPSSAGVPFGAYQRNYYQGFYPQGQEPEFLLGPMFERFQVNADNSISFRQYDDGQDRQLAVTNFKLENHSGTMTKGASQTINYTAVKLP